MTLGPNEHVQSLHKISTINFLNSNKSTSLYEYMYGPSLYVLESLYVLYDANNQ